MKSFVYSRWVLVLALVLATGGTSCGPLSGVEAQVGTYYVDPTGSDDTGDGSAAHPWHTIQHAATQVTAGDIVLINPGTYDGGITVDTSGTASQAITFRANGPGVVVEGSGGERDAFFVDRADYITVEGLRIQHADRAGMRISLSDRVTVRNCVFADNGTWGLFTDFSNYTLVEGCESYGAVDEHGIYISNSSDYPTIRGNRLHHNAGCGLHMNGDASMGGDGVISYGLIVKNVVYENGTSGGSGINMDGVTDTIVRNNLLYDNHAGGISLYRIDGGSGSMNNLVLNNTILMPSDGRWAINIPDVVDTGNKVFNNIIYSDHSWRGSIVIAAPGLAGFESDYNVVVDRFSVDGGDSTVSLPQWRAYGYDLHSLIASLAQLFADPGNDDYHLAAGGPAVNAGTALPDVSDDLEGNARPAGPAYDIGAYEYVPLLALHGTPGDRAIYLRWAVDVTLPTNSTWQITYGPPTGVPSSSVMGIPEPTRAYTLTEVTNHQWYSIVLNAMLDGAPVLTDTAMVMPTDLFVHLPLVLKAH
jgi:hypothetical protein